MHIHFDGKGLVLELDSPIAGARSHNVKIPLERLHVPDSIACIGWKQILDILKARHSDQRSSCRTVSTKASPIQYTLDQIKHVGKKKRREISFEDLFGESPSKGESTSQ